MTLRIPQARRDRRAGHQRAIGGCTLLELARSGNLGERIAAAIGLGVKAASAKSVREDPDAIGTVRLLCSDETSLVRYRAAEIAYHCPDIAAPVTIELHWLAESDPNTDVRVMARRALRSNDDLL